ncbi:hypothetical protein PF003_g21962 [Phytophthora fragariae]|nr:hypothetical protein PF003_g21962 [Phytophthora fragariae]
MCSTSNKPTMGCNNVLQSTNNTSNTRHASMNTTISIIDCSTRSSRLLLPGMQLCC